MAQKTKILLVGETWFVLRMHIKGFDMVPLGGYEDFGVWFVDALKGFDDIEIVHMPNHVALTSFPRTKEELGEYDVVVLSDIGKNTLQLYPEMFAIPMGPDRLDVIRDFVADGGGFIMAGGWNSYQGIRNIPGYHGTVIEEILPVEIRACDDRIEKPQGIVPEIVKPDHPIFDGLPSSWPMFLGYNGVKKKPEGEVLAKFGEDPCIAVRDFEKGRTMAFTSDLSKHWGTAMVEWEGYGLFWRNSARWLAKRV